MLTGRKSAILCARLDPALGLHKNLGKCHLLSQNDTSMLPLDLMCHTLSSLAPQLGTTCSVPLVPVKHVRRTRSGRSGIICLSLIDCRFRYDVIMQLTRMEHGCSWLGFIFCVSICTAQLSFIPTGQPNDVVVAASSNVYVSTNVGGSGRVYRLNGSLVQQEVLQFPSGATVLRISLSSDQSKLIVCVSNGSCIAYNAGNLNKDSVGSFQNVQAAGNNNVALVSAAVSGGGNSFYIGSSNGTVNLVGQYGLDGTAGNVSRTSGNLFNVTASTFTRNWYGGFVAGSYTYFVVQDTSPLSTAGVRVLRVCDNSNYTSIAAMYEIYLDCFLNGYMFGTVNLIGASLVSYPISLGGPYEDRLVLGMVTPPYSGNNPSFRSRVCTYSLSQINSLINSSYYGCSSGFLPWLSNSVLLQCSALCNLSSPGAIKASDVAQISYPVLVSPDYNRSYDLSYSLSFKH